MKKFLVNFQIGKNGVTEGIIESLSLAMKKHKQVRVSVLKSGGRDRTKIKEMALELERKSPYKFNYRIIGFTIVISKIQQNKRTKSL